MDNTITKKLDDFFSQYPSQEFKKGNILIQAASEPSGIFYVEEGIVRSYWISKEGTEITLNMFKPYAFLPMSWAIAEIPNTRFYEAMTTVKTKRAPKEAVIDFLRKEPDVMYDLLKRIYIGIEGLWTHIESLTNTNSYTKLVASLVILAKRFGKTENSEITVSLKMSGTEIANYAGMSRETASRELQKLKKENFVSFQKGIIVLHDIHKLEDLLLR